MVDGNHRIACTLAQSLSLTLVVRPALSGILVTNGNRGMLRGVRSSFIVILQDGEMLGALPGRVVVA